MSRIDKSSSELSLPGIKMERPVQTRPFNDINRPREAKSITKILDSAGQVPETNRIEPDLEKPWGKEKEPS